MGRALMGNKTRRNRQVKGTRSLGWLTTGRVYYFLPILLLAVAALALAFSQGTLGAQADLVDTVVIYDSRSERNSDINFRKVSEYYGLKWSRVDVSTTALNDSLFRDEQGNIVQAAHVDAATLAGMSTANLDVLKAAMANGLRLLITGITGASSEVSYLTNGEVTGAYTPSNKGYKYFITNSIPEVSLQFSGQTVDTENNANDYALAISAGATRTAVIVNGGSSPSSAYPIFVRYREGNGSIFLQSTMIKSNLEQSRLWELYYAWRSPGRQFEVYQYFSEIVPLLMFMRYAGGEEAWHSKRNYANLTIDDPPLTQPFWNLSYTNGFYTDLLSNMKAHNFVTTMAFTPKYYLDTAPDVAQLFRDNPNYYSLVVHGNNHNCPDLPASAGQEELQRIAREALWRMSEHERLTWIPFGKDMIFPCGNFDVESLKAIKYTGFLSTVNGRTIPDGSARPSYWDYGMYQADLDFSNFASIPRLDVEYSVPLHELFIGRPALVYTHHNFFSGGMDAFNSWADQYNAIAGGLEWRSLDYIVKRLYLEKLNDDQSISVMFYTRDVVVKNAYSTDRLFHFVKKETLDMPISAVKVNGNQLPFTVENGLLQFEVSIPAGQEAEATLHYTAEGSSPSPTPTSTPTATPTPNLSPTPTPTGKVDSNVITSLDDATDNYGSAQRNNDYPLITQTDVNGVRSLGLRFPNIGIPQGATITTAYVQVRIHSPSYDDPDMKIYGEASDNPLNFANTNPFVGSRAKTAANSTWTALGAGTGYKQSPELKSIVQEIVNRPGWQSGNSLNILMLGRSSNKMEACSYDNTLSGSPWAYACLNNPPKLHVEYTSQ